MYKKRFAKSNNKQLSFENFYLPFGGHLDTSNRWIQLAKLIPWEIIEERYATNFPNDVGNPAKSARMALGALVIKEQCGFSDEEVVRQIRENPYLQYFVGLHEFTTNKDPFEASSMTSFRKRFGIEIVMEITELVSKSELPDKNTVPEPELPDEEDDKPVPNIGILILDATCTPSDIQYPTDLGLLNTAREKLEDIIDTLYEEVKDTEVKPRTYRKVARKDYLAVAKQRKSTKKTVRNAIKKQLGYVSRNLKSIDKLIEKTRDLDSLSKKQFRDMMVISELYRQQQEMYDNKDHQIADRIVSISQPYIRPIIRGKKPVSTEFGAKIAISIVDGYAFLENLSWDNFNEGTKLKGSVEAYFKKFGCYPEAVIGDQIYRNRENIAYCKSLGIRLSGPRLGRPSTETIKEDKKVVCKDAKEHNRVEGKFGEGKRRYGLGLIMSKLRETSETEIALQFLVMNLEKRLRYLFFRVFQALFPDFWLYSEAEAA